MAEKLEELQLPRAQVEIESRGAIYAVPFFKDAELEKPSPSPEDAPGPGARHPPLDTSVSSGHPTSASPFPTAPAVPEAGVPLSCGVKPGSPSPAEEDGVTGAVGEWTGVGGAAAAAMPGLGCREEPQGWRRGWGHPRVLGSPQPSPSLPHPRPGHRGLGVGLCVGTPILSLPRPGSGAQRRCRTAV